MSILPHRHDALACITFGGFAKKVVVPKAYLSTPSVLIMEYVPGKMLVDALQDHFDTVARERGMTIDELR